MKHSDRKFPLLVLALSSLLLAGCAKGESSSQTSDDPNPGTSQTNPDITPDKTPDTTPEQTPDSTPDKTPDSTPEQTPDTKPDGQVDVRRIEFGETKYTDNGSLDDMDFTRDGLDVKVKSQEKCYSGGPGNAVRVGSSKYAGKFTLTLGGGLAPKKVSVYSYAYGAGKNYTVSLGLNGETFKSQELTSETPSKDASFEVDYGKVLNEISITGSVRFCLVAIELTFEAGVLPPPETGEPTPPPSSSSSPDIPVVPPETSTPTTPITPQEPVVPGVGTYYDAIDFTQHGSALKSALSARISSPYEDRGYDYAYTAYQTTDVGADGKIIDVYSSVKFDPIADHQGAPGKTNYSKEGDMYNREHTIPQSVFGKKAPMKNDLHHLLPTDGYVNNRRSNFPHGYVNPSTVKYTSTNGTLVGTGDARNGGYSSSACEVIDEYKGDIARIYFYFVTRYEKQMSGMGSFAAFSNNAYPSLSNWAMKTYLAWNDLDPISEKEVKRNEAIFAIQKNRNPFVDVPNLAHQIWDEAVK